MTKGEKSQINNLSSCFKKLENKEQNKSKATWRKEKNFLLIVKTDKYLFTIMIM